MAEKSNKSPFYETACAEFLSEFAPKITDNLLSKFAFESIANGNRFSIRVIYMLSEQGAIKAHCQSFLKESEELIREELLSSCWAGGGEFTTPNKLRFILWEGVRDSLGMVTMTKEELENQNVNMVEFGMSEAGQAVAYGLLQHYGSREEVRAALSPLDRSNPTLKAFLGGVELALGLQEFVSKQEHENPLPDNVEAWGAALDGEAVPIEELIEQHEAAKIALERKPRGKKARAFYRYVAALVAESDNLREIKGQAARDRQIEIGNELDRYKYPAANNGTEYNTAQDSGLIIDRAKRGGEYYPAAQRRKDEEEANKIQAEDLEEVSESAENSGSLDDKLPW